MYFCRLMFKKVADRKVMCDDNMTFFSKTIRVFLFQRLSWCIFQRIDETVK